MISSVRIVGSGLIGTSIGLCLKSAGVAVEMVDTNADNANLAQDLVNSTQVTQPDLIIVAVPISANQDTVIKQLNANPNSIARAVFKFCSSPINCSSSCETTFLLEYKI